MTTFNARHFIDKFSTIPDDRWTVGVMERSDTGERCAMGHCGISRANKFNPTEESKALSLLFAIHLGKDPEDINDFDHESWQPRHERYLRHPTPKARILDALAVAKQRGG